jgi:hypothetical protein
MAPCFPLAERQRLRGTDRRLSLIEANAMSKQPTNPFHQIHIDRVKAFPGKGQSPNSRNPNRKPHGFALQ